MEKRTALLGLLLLLLGSANTLISKYQDTTPVGRTSSGETVYFQHPSVQCGFMFLGEFLCLVPYFIWKGVIKKRQQQQQGARAGRFSSMVVSPSEMDLLSGRASLPTPGTAARERCIPGCISYKTMRKIVAFFIPAVCDALATTLLYTGLMYTYASTYQMLRGTMVLWCGLLTICILRRNLHIHHWIGICMIAAGSLLITASSVLDEDPTQYYNQPENKSSSVGEFPVVGAGLIILGQLMSAIQFVVEERYLAKYHVPALLAVGLEGFWGLIICFVLLPILSTVTATDGLPLDDVPQAFKDIMRIPRLQVSFAVNMICVAAFNFLALVVTSELSAAWRAVIDTSRTIIIWSVSVYMFEWEYFHGLQVIGFAVLVAGMSLYNELMRGCLRHPTAGPESPIGVGSHRGIQEPLIGGTSSALNMPDSSAPYSPSAGRPPLHPNSFSGSFGNHMARSIVMQPEVLSPHSLGSFVPGFSPNSVPSSNSDWPAAAPPDAGTPNASTGFRIPEAGSRAAAGASPGGRVASSLTASLNAGLPTAKQ